MIVGSFLFFLLIFASIGLASIRKSTRSLSDYLLAGQQTAPWLVALSAVASNNSGYMFIGMIGYTYTIGLASIWLMVGWIVGDFLSSLFVHGRLRQATEKEHALSFAEVLSTWGNVHYSKLRILGALITILFLGTYAGAQLNAGSKALHVLFGWENYLGAIIGAIIIMVYSFAGGIRASIWTDAAQSFVMIVSMAILSGYAISNVGGWSEFGDRLTAISPDYMSWFPSDFTTGTSFLFVLGWVFGGFAVVGQHTLWYASWPCTNRRR